MTAEQVKRLLPVIEAFANGKPIQYRGRPDNRVPNPEWQTINPNTTEFSLGHFTDPDEWRIKPEV